MGCTHCAESAGSNGRHMALPTFCQVLDWLEKISMPVVFLSGGEPTDHPSFRLFVRKALDRKFKTLALSNGLWSKTHLRDEYLNLGIDWQITNDARFYPTTVEHIDHPRVSFVNAITLLEPLGRGVAACKLYPAMIRKAPSCFNFLSLVRAHGSVLKAIYALRGLSKFCTPSIGVNGQLCAGEASACPSFGLVGDSDAKMTQAVLKFDCDACGLRGKLQPVYQQAIGISPTLALTLTSGVSRFR